MQVSLISYFRSASTLDIMSPAAQDHARLIEDMPVVLYFYKMLGHVSFAAYGPKYIQVSLKTFALLLQFVHVSLPLEWLINQIYRNKESGG